MFERFTDRARKVLALANKEAQRLNHEYIGTEHILLGLVKEGSGVGANVLKNLDVDLRKVRLEVEKLIKIGPEIVTMGKLPQMSSAKYVIQYAIQEARSLGHNYVGTEHLLLGLLREQDGVAAQVLINLKLKLEEIREELLNLLGASIDPSPSAQDRLLAREKREQGFRDQPLSRRYAAIAESYDRLKVKAVKLADYELAARMRDLGEAWAERVRTLHELSEKDPDSTTHIPPSVLKYCVEVAWETDDCPHSRELETAMEALLVGKTVLIIGELDSGRDKFLGQATSAAFEAGVDTDRPPTRFFAPNHDLMLKGEADGGYVGVLAALAKDMLATDACGFALRELHLYADPATFSERVIGLWEQTLLDCAAKQRPIIATTTPEGVTQLRRAWPRLFDHTVEIRIE